MKTYTVFMLKSKDNRVYIGMTGRSLNERCRKSAFIGCPRMEEAIKEYGWDFFEVSVVAEGLTKEQAEQRAKTAIMEHDSLNPSKGFNVDFAGNMVGRHTRETLNKMSQSQKGRVFSAEHLTKLQKPKCGGSLRRKVEKYSPNGVLLQVYDSIYEAIEDVDGSKTCIIRCCNGKQATHKGFMWAYGR